MEHLLSDLRFSARMLRKNPGFTLVAVIALALGIGANSAIFSVVNAVLLRPLPFKDPRGLVRIWGKYEKEGIPKNWLSQPELLDIIEQNQVFEEIAAFQTGGANLTGIGDPVRVNAAFVNASFFSILGIQAGIGRTFLEEEDQPGRERVVLVSDAVWRSRFGADPSIIGTTLGLSGNSYTIVGIMPPGFQFPSQEDIWAPLAIDKTNPGNRGNHGLEVVARLKPGVTPQQAQTDLTTIAGVLEQRYPNNYANYGFGFYPVGMLDELVGNVRPALYILLGAVGFVLLIACTNVANLLLARATVREKEVAIRTALGARRGRLIQQLLTESIMLAVIGSGLGLVLAWLGVKLFAALGPRDIPRIEEIGLDLRVVGFTVLIAVVTGVAFGLAPALQISKPDLHDTLKEGGRGSTSGRHLLRNALVVSEVAIALVLLIGAGLMIKSFRQLLKLDMGFRTEQTLTMRLTIPPTKYNDNTKVIGFYRPLLDKIKALPGVESAAAISQLPLSGAYSSGTTAVERADSEEGLRTFRGFPFIEADRRAVSPDYFRTLGIALKDGRLFTDADNETAPQVAIVDEAFEKRFWPATGAVGKRFVARVTDGTNIQWGQVVGVVSHVRHYGIDEVKQYGLEQEGREQVYFPYAQRPTNQMYLAIKTSIDPLALTSAVRGEVLSLDSSQPVYAVNSMDQLLSTSLSQRQLNMVLFAAFSAIALILASVGIYGVMSYSVTQRTHEIGIMMALGAQQKRVLGLVVRQGMTLALAGVGIGLVTAFALTRLMSSLLFGVSATDPITFAVISVLLAGVALVACFVPARRATQVDPMVALRYE
ncbi:MAG TPA: ABC transporter permease [Blastocatellia bacterium]|nr:ABC transporter permease [Blastocatellia bacterium]